MREFKAKLPEIYQILKPFWVSERKVFAWTLLVAFWQLAFFKFICL